MNSLDSHHGEVRLLSTPPRLEREQAPYLLPPIDYDGSNDATAAIRRP